jgi:translation initiation factor IF-1
MSGKTHMKKHNKTNTTSKSKELIFANDKEEYGEIIAPLGNCRFEVKIISTGQTINCPLRGKRKSGRSKQLIGKEDTVLLIPDVGSGYIIDSKYSPQDVMRLKKSGELTQVSEVAVSNKGTTVAFTSDVISEQQCVTEITDDFIANL